MRLSLFELDLPIRIIKWSKNAKCGKDARYIWLSAAMVTELKLLDQLVISDSLTDGARIRLLDEGGQWSLQELIFGERRINEETLIAY
uniref:Uncharacterized protein n=1 Tax=Parascaris univalens TaxID=6257 RepID=A0A914ZKD6_PARUN